MLAMFMRQETGHVWHWTMQDGFVEVPGTRGSMPNGVLVSGDSRRLFVNYYGENRMQAMTAKELELRGSFRFHEEFFTAVEMMQSGRLGVAPLITDTLPLDDMLAAFDLASDRSRAIKTQIGFG